MIVRDENEHNVVLIDKERVLEELLNIEDALIYHIAIRRGEKKLEPELCDTP